MTIGTKEAAIRLGKSQATVSRMCRQGQIEGAEHDKEGSPWHIPEESIENLLNERR